MANRRKSPRWLIAAAVVAVAAPHLAPLEAADWPGWRGPSRDGSLGEEWVCPGWPEELERRWQVRVGSGHASPVVSDERVFVHSRENDEEVVRALDLATGRELWRAAYAVKFKPAMGSVADGRLFTLGITGVLSAWDTVGGELLWRLDPAERFPKAAPRYGMAGSPLVDGGRVIAHLGGKGDGGLLALDAASGDEVWSWSVGGPEYASPVVLDIDGVRQVITQAAKSVVAVDASSGRLLWQLPFASSMTSHNVITPLPLDDGTVVISGKKRGLWAVRPSRGDEGWSASTVWRNDELDTELSSPVAESGRVFGLAPSRKGRFFALDAENGRPVWVSEGRDAEYAALLTAPGVVLALTAEGELWALDATAASMTRLATYSIRRWSTIAFSSRVARRSPSGCSTAERRRLRVCAEPCPLRSSELGRRRPGAAELHQFLRLFGRRDGGLREAVELELPELLVGDRRDGAIGVVEPALHLPEALVEPVELEIHAACAEGAAQHVTQILRVENEGALAR
jgi:outer membrane protein assembly factor BamB